VTRHDETPTQTLTRLSTLQNSNLRKEHKMKMKIRLKPLIAALLAGGSLGAAQAAAVSSEADIRSEVRTIVIDGDVSVADGNANVFIAQSEPGSHKREIKVITSGKRVTIEGIGVLTGPAPFVTR